MREDRNREREREREKFNGIHSLGVAMVSSRAQRGQ